MCTEIVFEYDGEKYSANRLKRIIDFYNKMQFKGGELECPLCGCDFTENKFFVCEKCKELLPIDEVCCEHNGLESICISCCEECEADRQIEFNYECDRDIAERGL